MVLPYFLLGLRPAPAACASASSSSSYFMKVGVKCTDALPPPWGGGIGWSRSHWSFSIKPLVKDLESCKKKTQTNPNITLYNIYNIINIIYILFFIKTPRCFWKVWSELTPDANVDLSIIWKLVEVRPSYYQNRQQTNFMII